MFRSLIAALTMFLLLAGNKAPLPEYSEGQVWEYQTRPADAGSLIKIQRIEPFPAGHPTAKVYHISVVGVSFGGRKQAAAIGHLPVSRETLDASVTRLATDQPTFPDASEGIEVWREASGGIFTSPIKEIVEVLDKQVSASQQ